MARWEEQAAKARDEALAALRRIQSDRSDLEMIFDLEPEHVQVTVDIPAQPGLAFSLHLNLQNVDELHLNTDGFWLEWFPVTDPKVVELYVDAVLGLLDGRHRIRELYRGERCIGADLQTLAEGGKWRTIGSYRGISLWPWPPVTYRIVRNVRDASAE